MCEAAWHSSDRHVDGVRKERCRQYGWNPGTRAGVVGATAILAATHRAWRDGVARGRLLAEGWVWGGRDFRQHAKEPPRGQTASGAATSTPPQVGTRRKPHTRRDWGGGRTRKTQTTLTFQPRGGVCWGVCTGNPLVAENDGIEAVDGGKATGGGRPIKTARLLSTDRGGVEAAVAHRFHRRCNEEELIRTRGIRKVPLSRPEIRMRRFLLPCSSCGHAAQRRAKHGPARQPERRGTTQDCSVVGNSPRDDERRELLVEERIQNEVVVSHQ